MASCWTTSALDNLGPGANSTPAWVTLDLTSSVSASASDGEGDTASWPGLSPNNTRNFDIVYGAAYVESR